MCVQYIGGCSVHRGMFSTSGNTMSTLRAYHEYMEECSVHRNIMSTSVGYHESIGGYHDACGEYHKYIGVFNIN